jgi:hypothetical protein
MQKSFATIRKGFNPFTDHIEDIQESDIKESDIKESDMFIIITPDDVNATAAFIIVPYLTGCIGTFVYKHDVVRNEFYPMKVTDGVCNIIGSTLNHINITSPDDVKETIEAIKAKYCFRA